MMIIDLMLAIVFILGNAFFVAAEFAMLKVRNSQIEILLREGNYFANIVKSITGRIDAYLSATQLGITLSSLALGWIASGMFVDYIFEILQNEHFQLSEAALRNIAIVITFTGIAFVHIVFGGLLPKALAIRYSESSALLLSMPLKIMSMIFKPFTWFLSIIANGILAIFSIDQKERFDIQPSSDELRFMLEEGSKSGVLDTEKHELLENAFDFSNIPVRQVIVPRMNISAIDVNDSIDDIIAQFIEEGFSRMPVYDTNIDNIIGEIYSKDMLSMMANPKLIVFDDIIRPAFFVQEDEKIHLVLKKMQKEHHHLAVVLNEFGGVAGLITMEDIIEELVGEIQDEYDEEEPLAEEISKDEFEINASISIDEINEIIPDALPESDDYETLGGYINMCLGRIPTIDEVFSIGNYRFTILKASNRRIEEVKLEIIKEKENADND